MPYSKNQGRKEELIKNLQKVLSNGKLKIIEEGNGEFIDELSNAQRSDTGRIINSHSYHLSDCAQYFVDLMPEPLEDQTSMTRDEWILYQDDKRREAEYKAYQRKNKKPSKEQAYKILRSLQRGRRW